MNRLDSFLEDLRRELAALPRSVANGAVQYYAEYFADARQAGISEDEILRKAGTPAQVAAAIADEVAITAAEARPGPLRLIRTSRRLLGKSGRQARSSRPSGTARAVRAARGTSLAFVSLFPLALALVFYLAAFALLAGTVAVAITLALNITAHPDLTANDRLAQIGLIAGLTGIGLLITLLVYRAGHAFGAMTLAVFRRIAEPPRSSGQMLAPAVDPEAAAPAEALAAAPAEASTAASAPPSYSAPSVSTLVRQRRRRTAWRVLLTLLLITGVAGLSLAAIFGLPQTYFRLWNSQRPADVQNATQLVSETPLRKVRIVTLSTHVVVQLSSSRYSHYRYEQLPYFQLIRTYSPDSVVLEEQGNGRLPLVQLLSAHEGTTTLTVLLPADANLELQVESSGGTIDIQVPSRLLTVRTYNGDIRLHGYEPRTSDVLVTSNGKVDYLTN